MARCLHQQARALLAHAAVHEPVTWEPPFAWAAGITWPGPDPDGISPEDLHPLIRSGIPVRAIAARLATTADHVRLAAARHPAPQLAPGSPAPPPAEPDLPGNDQLRDLASQGYGPRKIARITGCSERAIRQLLTSAGLHQPTPPDGKEDIDPHWLREHYQHRQRSLKDIAAETGAPVEDLAAAARKAGIRVRHGINARAHPLADLGGPDAFTQDVWNVFTCPGAEQRIRRLLTLPGQPGINQAARELGIRNAILTSQVRQLETIVGTELLRTGPDERLTLTAYGQRFARDVRPALESLAQSRKSKGANHGTLSRASPGIVHLPRQLRPRELFNYNETPSSRCSSSRDPYTVVVRVAVVPWPLAPIFSWPAGRRAWLLTPSARRRCGPPCRGAIRAASAAEGSCRHHRGTEYLPFPRGAFSHYKLCTVLHPYQSWSPSDGVIARLPAPAEPPGSRIKEGSRKRSSIGSPKGSRNGFAGMAPF
jgi:hypothetical protein